MNALHEAKEAVQTAENLIHSRVSECYQGGIVHPSAAPITLRDAMILTTALVKVMEAIEAMEAKRA